MVSSSNLLLPIKPGSVAQLVERLSEEQEVAGSKPAWPIKKELK